MKAMVINQFGDSSVFEQAEINKPEVKPGHLLIKIYATSVNTVDTMIRQMGPELGPLAPELPAVLGMDFAGVIEEVGENVTNFNVGDEVYGCAGGLADLQGTLAEYMVADAHLVALKPKSISMKEAASIPLVGITAYEGLARALVSSNQKVLVHGGGGGVGHLAVQIAKSMGADVYATISNDKQASLVESYGATPINYRENTVAEYVEKYTNNIGFDVVYDSVGGPNIAASFDAAALNGHVATTVSMIEMDLTTAHFKGLSLHVVFMLIPMLHNHKRYQHHEILTQLAKLVDEGQLKPTVDDIAFNYTEIGKAHDRLASGEVIGKVVVSVE